MNWHKYHRKYVQWIRQWCKIHVKHMQRMTHYFFYCAWLVKKRQHLEAWSHKQWKVPISSYVCSRVCCFVCRPHVSVWLSLDRLSWNLILETLHKSFEKLQVWLKSDDIIWNFTGRHKYVSVVGSSTKYFVARHQCKRNPFLQFHGDTELCYVVDSYL